MNIFRAQKLLVKSFMTGEIVFAPATQQTKPLRLASKTVNVKIRVEDYLNATFHNHTALALHNWKTYGEMRKLAQEKYGVQLAEITLPGQTLEQGLDVLEIMRNIHLFVSRYQYNLHSQVGCLLWLVVHHHPIRTLVGCSG